MKNLNYVLTVFKKDDLFKVFLYEIEVEVLERLNNTSIASYLRQLAREEKIIDSSFNCVSFTVLETLEEGKKGHKYIRSTIQRGTIESLLKLQRAEGKKLNSNY